MSLDRLQSKQGLLQINAEPNYTVASSLSSVASNQLRGGYQFGDAFALAQADAVGTVGGAVVVPVTPTMTIGQSTAIQSFAASTGIITHGNAAAVCLIASAGGLHGIMPPSYNGQVLSLINLGGSASIASVLSTSGAGAGSTTTVALPVLLPATSMAASVGRVLIGCVALGGIATNSTTAVWRAIA